MGKALGAVGIALSIPVLLIGAVVSSIVFNPLMLLTEDKSFLITMMFIGLGTLIGAILVLIASIIHIVRNGKVSQVNIS